MQDLLIYIAKGISEVVMKGKLDVKFISEVNHQVLKSLFITITNANFDGDAIEVQINKMIGLRNELKKQVSGVIFGDAAVFEVSDRTSMLDKASTVGVLLTENGDVRSLREMIIYGRIFYHRMLQKSLLKSLVLQVLDRLKMILSYSWANICIDILIKSKDSK